jgi:hypothetical protein
MNLNDLRLYRRWLLNSPQMVLNAVIDAGGWQTVFPNSVPQWANKVRNYFNETPKSLRLLGQAESAKWLAQARKHVPVEKTYIARSPIQIHPAQPAIEKILEFQAELIDIDRYKDLLAYLFALSGDVYVDDAKRIWYQMSPGGNIYHYGSQPTQPMLESALAAAKTQAFIPVFKLVSPDHTGGSRECIITNPVVAKVWLGGTVPADLRSPVIGSVNATVDVSQRIVTDPVLQGSYNYSETIEVGLREHELRDVKPHSSISTFYVNPSPASTSLALRRFPKVDNYRLVLADQFR